MDISFFNKNRNLLLSLLLIIFLIINVPKLRFNHYEDNLDVFYDYIGNEEISSELWISNPAFIAYSNVKADLIYYPLYNSKKIDILTDDIDNAEHILINTCDLLPCPVSDNTCSQKHDNFINLLENRFNMPYYNEFNQCGYYIFN